MIVTARMIKSFTDIKGECKTSLPCQHGPMEIKLKDGRSVSVQLEANEIYSILLALREEGVNHKYLAHFSRYQDAGQIPLATDVLTKIFNESAYTPSR